MKKIKLKKNSIYIIVLCLICIFAVYENYRFLKEDNTPLSYDMLNIYFISIDNFNFLMDGNFKELISYLGHSEIFYPPFITLQPLFFYPFLGISEDIILITTIFHINLVGVKNFFSRYKIINLFFIFITFSLIISFWYTQNITLILTRASNVREYVILKHFQGYNNITIWYSIGKEYIHFIKNHFLGDILFFLTILSCLYLIIKEINHLKTNFYFFSIIISFLFIIFPFLNIPASTRYFLPILVLIMIINSKAIIDVSKRIEKNFLKSKISKISFYIFLGLTLFFIFFLNFYSIVQEDYLIKYHSPYDMGLITPKTYFLESEIIFDRILNSYISTNSTGIIVLPTNELMYIVVSRLDQKDIYLEQKIFCQIRPDIKNHLEECGIPENYKQQDFFPKDNFLVVDSNFYLSENDKINLIENFPERYLFIEDYLLAWNEYKNSTILVEKLPEIYIDEEVLSISIYHFFPR